MENDTAAIAATELFPTAAIAPDADTETEKTLTTAISELWSVHLEAQSVVTKTKEELKVIRHNLAAQLHAMKQLLAKPGRNGQWTCFLTQRGIPRTTADRLIAGHLRPIAPEPNGTDGAVSEYSIEDVEKFANAMWPKLAKTLTTPESVYDFVRFILTRSGTAHEWRDLGILMFHPMLTAHPEPGVMEQLTEANIDPADAEHDDVV